MKNINVPTLVAQVHDDSMTRPEAVQSIYDALPVEDKQLYWIEGTDASTATTSSAFVHPELPIDWFDKQLK